MPKNRENFKLCIHNNFKVKFPFSFIFWFSYKSLIKYDFKLINKPKTMFCYNKITNYLDLVIISSNNKRQSKSSSRFIIWSICTWNWKNCKVIQESAVTAFSSNNKIKPRSFPNDFCWSKNDRKIIVKLRPRNLGRNLKKKTETSSSISLHLTI